MSVRRIELLVWALALLLTVWVGVVRWKGAVSAAESRSNLVGPGLSVSLAHDTELLNAAVGNVVDGDLFRLDRRPAPVAYEPELEGAPPPVAATRPPRPALAVTGILGGPPWEAVLEGVPGREGSVIVRKGDILGELRIRAVRPDTVTIEGADTTWKLTVRRAWP